MLAFAFSLASFFFLLVIGISVTPKKIFEYDSRLFIFVSPAIGLACSVLYFFTLNRFGLPVRDITFPFCIISLLIFLFRLKSLNEYHYPFRFLIKIVIAPIGILVSAWPILNYGFHWLSYVNDDMNNYVLAAMRFYNNGFYAIPNRDLFRGADYTQAYYFMHVVNHQRPGSELFLAALSRFNHGGALGIFMPGILTLQMILLFSTLALSRVIAKPSTLRTRITFLLSIIMPLTSLGFLYQLIGQVGGIAIGVSLITLLGLQNQVDWSIKYRKNYLILGLLFVAQLIWYPEFLPFLGIGIFVILLSRKNLKIREVIISLLAILLISGILIEKYLYQAISFGLSQITRAQSGNKIIFGGSQLFPYFLKPHGMVAFMGLEPLNRWLNEPSESLLIIVSFLLIFSLLFQIIKKRVLTQPAVVFFILILIVFSYMVYSKNGFAAFKSAMYIQPFLIVTIATIAVPDKFKWSYRKPKILFFAVSFICFSLLNMSTNEFYASASTGESNNGFNEIPSGSSSDTQKLISSAVSKYKPDMGTIISTTSNLSILKLEAISGKGKPIIFPSADAFNNIFDSNIRKNFPTGKKFFDYSFGGNKTTFSILNNGVSSNEDQYYLIAHNPYEAINHTLALNPMSGWLYSLEKAPENYLIFIDSSLGHIYFKSVDRSKAVLFQPEKNPMVPGSFMQSVGDNLLFEIIHPSPNPILEFDVTNTVLPQYTRQIPVVNVLGHEMQSSRSVGRGSAHLRINLGKPVEIGGHQFFLVHIDQELSAYHTNLGKIASIYGKEIRLDPRKVSLYITNVSVTDGSKLEKKEVPTEVNSFPTDLQTEGLQYSGIYEDGWIGADSYFDLSDKSKTALAVSGSVPILKGNPSFKTVIQVSVDGKVVMSKKLVGGTFNITAPWDSKGLSTNPKRVSIHFSNEQILPSPDGRPASAQITFLGFK